VNKSTKTGTFKPQKILVIGANGFIGGYLSEYLKSQDYRVVEADKSGVDMVMVDALQPDQVMKLLKEINPDVIFNLIGYTDESHPDTIYRLNIFPLIHIAGCVTSLGLSTRIITMGSAAEYGPIREPRDPLVEDDIKVPVSHYGVSKVAQTSLARVFFKSNASDIIIARPFNIIGYGMSSYSVPACFVEQFLQRGDIKGRIEIRTGNLDPIRDFLSIHDVISALHYIMLRGSPGHSYNICSGSGITVRAILTGIASIFSGKEYQILENKSMNSAINIPWSIGDNSKLKSLGWKQQSSIEDGMNELVRLMEKDFNSTGLKNR
jgi:GDP-4-dehydro-6-deoxy-D-mannose reductase